MGIVEHFVITGASNTRQVRTIVDEVEKQWGRIDILVCNVGSGTSVPPGDETAAEW